MPPPNTQSRPPFENKTLKPEAVETKATPPAPVVCQVCGATDGKIHQPLPDGNTLTLNGCRFCNPGRIVR